MKDTKLEIASAKEALELSLKEGLLHHQGRQVLLNCFDLVFATLLQHASMLENHDLVLKENRSPNEKGAERKLSADKALFELLGKGFPVYDMAVSDENSSFGMDDCTSSADGTDFCRNSMAMRKNLRHADFSRDLTLMRKDPPDQIQVPSIRLPACGVFIPKLSFPTPEAPAFTQHPVMPTLLPGAAEAYKAPRKTPRSARSEMSMASVGSADSQQSIEDVLFKQIERGSLFAEELLSDPAMQKQGQALMKSLQGIADDDDMQAALDSAVMLAQGVLENERLRKISSAMMFPVKKVSSIAATTVCCVAGHERVHNAVERAIDTTGALLTSPRAKSAATFGMSTTLAVAGSLAHLANYVKQTAFPEKTLKEMEHDVKVLKEDIRGKLSQFQPDQTQSANDDEDEYPGSEASLVARLRENQR